MKEKLIAMLSKIGLITDSNKKEIEDKINDSELKEFLSEEKMTLPANLDGSTKAIVEKLIEQNNALSANVKSLRDALAEEKSQRDAAIKTEQERIEREHKQKVDNAVKKLLEEKKITEADKIIWQKLYEKDFEATEKAASQIFIKKESGKEPENKNAAGSDTPKVGKPDRKALREAIAEQMQDYSNN